MGLMRKSIRCQTCSKHCKSTQFKQSKSGKLLCFDCIEKEEKNDPNIKFIKIFVDKNLKGEDIRKELKKLSFYIKYFEI